MGLTMLSALRHSSAMPAVAAAKSTETGTSQTREQPICAKAVPRTKSRTKSRGKWEAYVAAQTESGKVHPGVAQGDAVRVAEL